MIFSKLGIFAASLVSLSLALSDEGLEYISKKVAIEQPPDGPSRKIVAENLQSLGANADLLAEIIDGIEDKDGLLPYYIAIMLEGEGEFLVSDLINERDPQQRLAKRIIHKSEDYVQKFLKELGADAILKVFHSNPQGLNDKDASEAQLRQHFHRITLNNWLLKKADPNYNEPSWVLELSSKCSGINPLSECALELNGHPSQKNKSEAQAFRVGIEIGEEIASRLGSYLKTFERESMVYHVASQSHPVRIQLQQRTRQNPQLWYTILRNRSFPVEQFLTFPDQNLLVALKSYIIGLSNASGNSKLSDYWNRVSPSDTARILFESAYKLVDGTTAELDKFTFLSMNTDDALKFLSNESPRSRRAISSHKDLQDITRLCSEFTFSSCSVNMIVLQQKIEVTSDETIARLGEGKSVGRLSEIRNFMDRMGFSGEFFETIRSQRLTGQNLLNLQDVMRENKIFRFFLLNPHVCSIQEGLDHKDDIVAYIKSKLLNWISQSSRKKRSILERFIAEYLSLDILNQIGDKTMTSVSDLSMTLADIIGRESKIRFTLPFSAYGSLGEKSSRGLFEKRLCYGNDFDECLEEINKLASNYPRQLAIELANSFNTSEVEFWELKLQNLNVRLLEIMKNNCSELCSIYFTILNNSLFYKIKTLIGLTSKEVMKEEMKNHLIKALTSSNYNIPSWVRALVNFIRREDANSIFLVMSSLQSYKTLGMDKALSRLDSSFSKGLHFADLTGLCLQNSRFQQSRAILDALVTSKTCQGLNFRTCMQRVDRLYAEDPTGQSILDRAPTDDDPASLLIVRQFIADINWNLDVETLLNYQITLKEIRILRKFLQEASKQTRYIIISIMNGPEIFDLRQFTSLNSPNDIQPFYRSKLLEVLERTKGDYPQSCELVLQQDGIDITSEHFLSTVTYESSILYRLLDQVGGKAILEHSLKLSKYQVDNLNRFMEENVEKCGSHTVETCIGELNREWDLKLSRIRSDLERDTDFKFQDLKDVDLMTCNEKFSDKEYWRVLRIWFIHLFFFQEELENIGDYLKLDLNGFKAATHRIILERLRRFEFNVDIITQYVETLDIESIISVLEGTKGIWKDSPSIAIDQALRKHLESYFVLVFCFNRSRYVGNDKLLKYMISKRFCNGTSFSDCRNLLEEKYESDPQGIILLKEKRRPTDLANFGEIENFLKALGLNDDEGNTLQISSQKVTIQLLNEIQVQFKTSQYRDYILTMVRNPQIFVYSSILQNIQVTYANEISRFFTSISDKYPAWYEYYSRVIHPDEHKMNYTINLNYTDLGGSMVKLGERVGLEEVTAFCVNYSKYFPKDKNVVSQFVFDGTCSNLSFDDCVSKLNERWALRKRQFIASFPEEFHSQFDQLSDGDFKWLLSNCEADQSLVKFFTMILWNSYFFKLQPFLGIQKSEALEKLKEELLTVSIREKGKDNVLVRFIGSFVSGEQIFKLLETQSVTEELCDGMEVLDSLIRRTMRPSEVLKFCYQCSHYSASPNEKALELMLRENVCSGISFEGCLNRIDDWYENESSKPQKLETDLASESELIEFIKILKVPDIYQTKVIERLQQKQVSWGWMNKILIGYNSFDDNSKSVVTTSVMNINLIGLSLDASDPSRYFVERVRRVLKRSQKKLPIMFEFVQYSLNERSIIERLEGQLITDLKHMSTLLSRFKGKNGGGDTSRDVIRYASQRSEYKGQIKPLQDEKLCFKGDMNDCVKQINAYWRDLRDKEISRIISIVGVNSTDVKQRLKSLDDEQFQFVLEILPANYNMKNESAQFLLAILKNPHIFRDPLQWYLLAGFDDSLPHLKRSLIEFVKKMGPSDPILYKYLDSIRDKKRFKNIIFQLATGGAIIEVNTIDALVRKTIEIDVVFNFCHETIKNREEFRGVSPSINTLDCADKSFKHCIRIIEGKYQRASEQKRQQKAIEKALQKIFKPPVRIEVKPPQVESKSERKSYFERLIEGLFSRFEFDYTPAVGKMDEDVAKYLYQEHGSNDLLIILVSQWHLTFKYMEVIKEMSLEDIVVDFSVSLLESYGRDLPIPAMKQHFLRYIRQPILYEGVEPKQHCDDLASRQRHFSLSMLFYLSYYKVKLEIGGTQIVEIVYDFLKKETQKNRKEILEVVFYAENPEWLSHLAKGQFRGLDGAKDYNEACHYAKYTASRRLKDYLESISPQYILYQKMLQSARKIDINDGRNIPTELALNILNNIDLVKYQHGILYVLSQWQPIKESFIIPSSGDNLIKNSMMTFYPMMLKSGGNPLLVQMLQQFTNDDVTKQTYAIEVIVEFLQNGYVFKDGRIYNEVVRSILSKFLSVSIWHDFMVDLIIEILQPGLLARISTVPNIPDRKRIRNFEDAENFAIGVKRHMDKLDSKPPPIPSELLVQRMQSGTGDVDFNAGLSIPNELAIQLLDCFEKLNDFNSFAIIISQWTILGPYFRFDGVCNDLREAIMASFLGAGQKAGMNSTFWSFLVKILNDQSFLPPDVDHRAILQNVLSDTLEEIAKWIFNDKTNVLTTMPSTFDKVFLCIFKMLVKTEHINHTMLALLHAHGHEMMSFAQDQGMEKELKDVIDWPTAMEFVNIVLKKFKEYNRPVSILKRMLLTENVDIDYLVDIPEELIILFIRIWSDEEARKMVILITTHWKILSKQTGQLPDPSNMYSWFMGALIKALSRTDPQYSRFLEFYAHDRDRIIQWIEGLYQWTFELDEPRKVENNTYLVYSFQTTFSIVFQLDRGITLGVFLEAYREGLHEVAQRLDLKGYQNLTTWSGCIEYAQRLIKEFELFNSPIFRLVNTLNHHFGPLNFDHSKNYLNEKVSIFLLEKFNESTAASIAILVHEWQYLKVYYSALDSIDESLFLAWLEAAKEAKVNTTLTSFMKSFAYSVIDSTEKDANRHERIKLFIQVFFTYIREGSGLSNGIKKSSKTIVSCYFQESLRDSSMLAVFLESFYQGLGGFYSQNYTSERGKVTNLKDAFQFAERIKNEFLKYHRPSSVFLREVKREFKGLEIKDVIIEDSLASLLLNNYADGLKWVRLSIIMFWDNLSPHLPSDANVDRILEVIARILGNHFFSHESIAEELQAFVLYFINHESFVPPNQGHESKSLDFRRSLFIELLIKYLMEKVTIPNDRMDVLLMVFNQAMSHSRLNVLSFLFEVYYKGMGTQVAQGEVRELETVTTIQGAFKLLNYIKEAKLVNPKTGKYSWAYALQCKLKGAPQFSDWNFDNCKIIPEIDARRLYEINDDTLQIVSLAIIASQYAAISPFKIPKLLENMPRSVIKTLKGLTLRYNIDGNLKNVFHRYVESENILPSSLEGSFSSKSQRMALVVEEAYNTLNEGFFTINDTRSVETLLKGIITRLLKRDFYQIFLIIAESQHAESISLFFSLENGSQENIRKQATSYDFSLKVTDHMWKLYKERQGQKEQFKRFLAEQNTRNPHYNLGNIPPLNWSSLPVRYGAKRKNDCLDEKVEGFKFYLAHVN